MKEKSTNTVRTQIIFLSLIFYTTKLYLEVISILSVLYHLQHKKIILTANHEVISLTAAVLKVLFHFCIDMSWVLGLEGRTGC